MNLENQVALLDETLDNLLLIEEQLKEEIRKLELPPVERMKQALNNLLLIEEKLKKEIRKLEKELTPLERIKHSNQMKILREAEKNNWYCSK